MGIVRGSAECEKKKLESPQGRLITVESPSGWSCAEIQDLGLESGETLGEDGDGTGLLFFFLRYEMRVFQFFGATIGAFLMSVQAAEAQSSWEEQLQNQTVLKSGSGYADMASNGYSLVDVPKTELLAANDSTTVGITLPAGQSYALLGVCDNDCSDLDLALYQNGTELVKDVTQDDWPVLQVDASGSSSYEVRVTMYSCSTSTCGYQLSVWQGSGSASPSASSGGSNWEEQLQQQTSIKSGEGYGNFAAQGYSLMDVAQTELLAASASSDVEINLPPGSEYALLGVCDNDCSDLDLTLIKGGMELDQDTTTDDWPVLKVTPTSSSNYTVRVSMYNCSTSTCGYQLSVWKR